MPVIDVHCGCGATYHAEENQVGKSLRCTKCHTVLTIQSVNAHPPEKVGPGPIDTTHFRVPPIEITVKQGGLPPTFFALMGVALVMALALLSFWWFSQQSEKAQSATSNKEADIPFMKEAKSTLPELAPIHPALTERTRSPSSKGADSTPPMLARTRIPPCAEGQPVETLFTGQDIEDSYQTY